MKELKYKELTPSEPSYKEVADLLKEDFWLNEIGGGIGKVREHRSACLRKAALMVMEKANEEAKQAAYYGNPKTNFGGFSEGAVKNDGETP